MQVNNSCEFNKDNDNLNIVRPPVFKDDEIGDEIMDKFRNKKYMMHKYWGKKPAYKLKEIIETYSNENDLLLDPCAGYGTFAGEAVLLNRNVISNDLNPIATFISKGLLSENVDLNKFELLLEDIKDKTKEYEKKWYDYNGSIITTALRTNNDEVVKLRVKQNNKIIELETLSKNYLKEFNNLERNYVIDDWFPTNKLIVNSRISAKETMSVADLFPLRSLACHAKLLSIIDSL